MKVGSVDGCESAAAGSLRYWLASRWAAGLLGRKGVFFSEATCTIPKEVGPAKRVWSRLGEAQLVLAGILDESNTAVIFYAAKSLSVD